MLDGVKRNIIYGNTYCCIEHLGSDTDPVIKTLVCKKQKGELEVFGKTEVATIKDVRAFDEKLKYAHLIINNHQVLQKTVENGQSLSEIVIVNQAFPNIDVDSFYYEILRVKEKAYVYICRKKYVDELIKSYEKERIFITQWNLGSTSIHTLVPFLKNQVVVHTPAATVSLSNGEIQSIDRLASATFQNEYYDIEGIKIEGDYINTLGGAIGIVGGVDDDQVATNFSKEVLLKQANFKQYRFFALGLPLALGTLLIILLVNFLIYNHYYTEVAVLQEIATTNTLQKKRLVKKDSIVSQKQKLFEDVIASASSSASYFIDAIASDMPHTILLEKLQYQPLEKKIRNNKPVQVEVSNIIITGETTVNKDLSSWVSSLEDLEFIERASMNIEKKGKNIHFSITLTMKS
ncbi:general secretion pathway protein [Dokdonia pacifica]|uniref:Fimbrial assembly protein (PilN) n=1 Tax=Dokdonia pacifica TaxID=1627892 RepID=A0A239E7B7_9FLAO|nr:hypothetical protein [Dokdonia pacifica]GGG25206.1 general secretion pathway protein [Dokdonia pacifica]SNS39774.1 hypothetical protein SAMN06265376_1149 [Dokdonia pacifica]